MQDIRHITFHKIQLESLRLRFSEIEQLIDQIEQPICIQVHYLQIIPDFIGYRFGRQHILKRTLYECKRRTYLMSYIREEIYFSRVQFPLLLTLKLLHGLLMLLLGPSPKVENNGNQRT